MENAAHALQGRTLKSGWLVSEKITKNDNATGSFFSVCYKVEKGNEICFLKAFDFVKFLSIKTEGKTAIDVMSDMIEAFKYERDLSNYCKNKHVTKVSFVKEAGEEEINGFNFGTVPYLIFDLAEGDVRSKLDFSKNLEIAWRLRSIHNVAVGLKQLHYIEVSHQDLKPSNILVFANSSKIGDLGRSVAKSLNAPHKDYVFCGDWSYAPPELMYNYFEKDWKRRVFATDCYLLGSLIVFYFSGVSMNALLTKYLKPNHKLPNWSGTFEEVKGYLLEAFSKALIEFSSSLPNQLKDELRLLIEWLCHPIPEMRGHPKNIQNNIDQFNLERIVSKLNILARKAEVFVNS